MIRIGTGGIPLRCEGGVVEGIETLREIGLNSMELEFVRQVFLTEKTAAGVRKAASDNDITLSVHAPYFINLASKEKQKIEASKKRILKSARIGRAAGAGIVVFHPGFYSGRPPEEAFELIREAVVDLRRILDGEGNAILLGPETTGKVKQFGTFDELIRLCRGLDGVIPAVDFSHMHARYNGNLKTESDFEGIFEKYRAAFGKKHMHCHFSGIEYTEKGGERKHLPIGSGQPDYRLLANVIRRLKPDMTLISESPNLEEDALKLKNLLGQ
ncbi:MAG: TIM barrel protein [Candidatus Altiarchaeota archaeon]